MMQSPATILVVDDEPEIRSFLQELLTLDGHQVTAVESGEDALAEMVNHEYDLALVDLRLKQTSGLEVMSSLRQKSPDIVTILLTAHGTMETAVEALRQGAHDYLEKPCTSDTLRESVRAGLKRHRLQVQQRQLINNQNPNSREAMNPAENGAVSTTPTWPYDETSEENRFIKRGGLSIDFMAHVVLLNGNLMELSPTEFDLLAYLCIQAPRVVSSEELVREVQRYYMEPAQASEIVRYHIYRIRRKAKAVATQTDLIRTVRGIGYTVGDRYMP